MNEELEAAMWAGDIDRLRELAPCQCCCADHFFDCCEARVWGGCRGQDSMTRADHESWAHHYVQFHGMTRDQFFGLES